MKRALTADMIDALAKAIATAAVREITALLESPSADLPVASAPTAQRVETGPIVIDVDRHEVLIDGVETPLKPREFALLAALARNAGRLLSREQLLELAWPSEVALELESTRNVDVVIRRLRQALGAHAKRIETVHGGGYKLRDR